jgi:hypothetical protein
MTTFQGKRKILTADCHVNASPEVIFPELCPTREYDWIEQWECDLIYSRSGYAELDCVFTTSFPKEENDTWVVSRYEPPERIEFIRVNPDRAMRYIVSLTPLANTTRITWTQFITGLNEAGNRVVENLSENAYSAMIDAAGKMLTHYWETGERMKMDVFEEMNK